MLVYAELDDNPWHLMDIESVKGPTGTPWPYVEELQEGCTFEHVGYHLIWICAMFGPAVSVTAFSDALIEHKASVPLSPAGTPDFSAGCLHFASGVAARITCSIIAPRDQRLRIIGDEGEISTGELQPLPGARSAGALLKDEPDRPQGLQRTQPAMDRQRLRRCGRRLPLVRHWKSLAIEAERGVHGSHK